MGLFSNGSQSDRDYKAARRALDDWCDEHDHPIAEGSKLEAENLRLQGAVTDAERHASGRAKFWR